MLILVTLTNGVQGVATPFLQVQVPGTQPHQDGFEQCVSLSAGRPGMAGNEVLEKEKSGVVVSAGGFVLA